jgi:hypothetical protein
LTSSRDGRVHCAVRTVSSSVVAMVFHLQLGGLDVAADAETAITYEKSFAFLFRSVNPFLFPGCKSFDLA